MADETRLNTQQWKVFNGITHKKHKFIERTSKFVNFYF